MAGIPEEVDPCGVREYSVVGWWRAVAQENCDSAYRVCPSAARSFPFRLWPPLPARLLVVLGRSRSVLLQRWNAAIANGVADLGLC